MRIHNPFVLDFEAKLSDVTMQLRRSRVKGRRNNSKQNKDVPSFQPQTLVSPTECSSSVREIRYSDVEIEERVSGGGFSIVYKANWMSLPVAVKRIFDPNITKELMDEFRNEVSMLSRFRHPNIVQILATVSTPPNLCVVCEWMARGSLHHVLHASKVKLSEARSRSLAIQASLALHFIHTENVVHRDIKPMNFLVDEHLRLKLGDFGFAKKINSVQNNKNGELKNKTTIIGSPPYMAPELWMGEIASKKSDVYALGIVLWEIFTRGLPFCGMDPKEIRQRVLKGTRPSINPHDEEQPMHYGTQAGDLIQRCWKEEKFDRPSSKEVLGVMQKFR